MGNTDGNSLLLGIKGRNQKIKKEERFWSSLLGTK